MPPHPLKACLTMAIKQRFTDLRYKSLYGHALGVPVLVSRAAERCVASSGGSCPLDKDQDLLETEIMGKLLRRVVARATACIAGATVAAGVIVSSLAASAPAYAADDLRTWQQSIATLIAKKQVYPRSALAREIEGEAKVRVTIDRSGNIATFDMFQSTGHKVLDKEVERLMGRINPLPSPPSNLAEAQLTFVLPLAWRLQ